MTQKRIDKLMQLFQSHEDLSDAELIEMITHLRDTRTLWTMRGDYQRAFALLVARGLMTRQNGH